MKISVAFYVGLATVLLVLLIIAVAVDVSLNVVFILMCLGQLALLIMVYKVLSDNYTTTKTFKDFYQDYNVSETDNYR
ncbi:MAG: hypothetical protein GYB32_11145 [Algicola sp.]|nr:hypothetical protein [Algicola sp.]